MAKKRSTKRKLRVGFKANRQARGRSNDWTRQYKAGEEQIEDTQNRESVRAKGELSRKRTIIVDENDLPVINQSQWRPALVIRVHGLICHVIDDDDNQWQCTVRRILRTRQIDRRSPVSVGDRVWLSDQSASSSGDQRVGVIEQVAPRTTTLSRRDRRKREHTIVANADQLLAVVSVAEPRLRPHLVDRYIVAALKGNLHPILCFNKIDLLATGNLLTEEDDGNAGNPVDDAIQEFRDLGYQCIPTSIVTGQGVDDLRDALQDRMTILAGQSGVGKSSLINLIQPGLNLKTCDVSSENEKGRHTTTLAELFPLDIGGCVIDTPGVRAFDLWAVEPGELEVFFVELVPYVQKCHFNDCTHRHEEGCAVVEAVQSGHISTRRYFSYLKMFADA